MFHSSSIIFANEVRYSEINFDTISREIPECPGKFHQFLKLHKLRITRNSSVCSHNETRLKPI